MVSAREIAEARAIAAAVCDPEIPVLTLDDLGVLRDVRAVPNGGIEVDLTPTYSGCPALEVMRDDVTSALQRRGYANVRVRMVLAPAWTTDWMSDQGRRKLHEYGIAPPGGVAAAGCQGARPAGVACPQCGSAHTAELSHFGSTPCKALFRCGGCREPFDHFKPH
ncbi:MAG: 1,2-phenylacetyl-CoA epoxidase subunit PaaD [Candidatus Dormibacteria bacterium]